MAGLDRSAEGEKPGRRAHAPRLLATDILDVKRGRTRGTDGSCAPAPSCPSLPRRSLALVARSSRRKPATSAQQKKGFA
ncbi:unnamed protein product [Lampetra planeri]